MNFSSWIDHSIILFCCDISWIIWSIKARPSGTTLELMIRTKLKKLENNRSIRNINLKTGVLQTTQLYNPGFLLLFNGLE